MIPAACSHKQLERGRYEASMCQVDHGILKALLRAAAGSGTLRHCAYSGCSARGCGIASLIVNLVRILTRHTYVTM